MATINLNDLQPAVPRDYREIARARTAYEITLNGVAICYTNRKTKEVLFNAVRCTSDTWSKWITEEELDSDFSYSKNGGLVFGGGSLVAKFSGRTERDASMAIIHG